jgi:hypothetical protein
MPTIPDKCEFEVGIDKIRFQTQANGDTVYIKGVHFDEDQASALAYLINLKKILNIEIKEK